MATAGIGLALSLLGGIGGLFGKSKQTSDTNSTTTTNPNYDPKTAAFRDFLLNSYQNNLSSLPSQNQYQDMGLKNILHSSENVNSGVGDILASRGLSRTTGGGSTAFDTSYKQGGNVSDFLTNSPFTYQQNIAPALSSGAAFLSSLPIGTTQTSNSHTVGTGGPSSPAAGFLSGGAQGLATYLGQQNAFNNWQKGQWGGGQYNGSAGHPGPPSPWGP